jgi:hypothetical protein
MRLERERRPLEPAPENVRLPRRAINETSHPPILEEARDIDRGGSAADHSHAGAREFGEVMDVETVRDSISEQPQRLGNMAEGADSDRNDDPARMRAVAVLEAERESIPGPLDRDDRRLFEKGREPSLEREPVLAKRFEADGPSLVIGNRTFRRKPGERIEILRVAQIRRKRIGFQRHAFGHVPKPTVHLAPEDTEPDPSGRQVRRKRQPIGASANDGDSNCRRESLLQLTTAAVRGKNRRSVVCGEKRPLCQG